VTSDEGRAKLAVEEQPDWTRAEIVRRLGCVLEDGALLALGAARPKGAGGHGDEAVSARLVDGDGEAMEIAEARLTTEYDAGGQPQRIGLELLPAEEAAPPLRAAGTAAEDGGFDFVLDGTPGTAVYEIVRAP
jgi:hypothetical protein